MPVRLTLLSLIPKHYYRTTVQRQIRCCGVLWSKSEKKVGLFQSHQQEMERWKVESEKGKTFNQFLKEMKERQLKEQEGEEAKNEGKESIKSMFDPLLNGIKKRFPRTYDLFFLVRNGFWNLVTDVKQLVILNYKLSKDKSQLRRFNLQELEILYEGFIHMKRMIPVLILGLLPFGNFFVIIIAYLKPLRLLTPHFWTDQQKALHIKQKHDARISVFQPIILNLEVKLPSEDTSPLYPKFHKLLLSVEEGHIPTPSELLVCQSLFSEYDIYALNKFSSNHLDNLLTLHSQNGSLIKLTWLEEWAAYLYLVDARIKLDGGASQLPIEQLKKFCFQRGVNSNAMSEEEMRQYLDQWVEFSLRLPRNCYSLLLHAPAFFGYNHKSNYVVADDHSVTNKN